MAKYTEVGSEYIKRLIRQTPWSGRKRIDDLIALRRFILERPGSFAEAMHYFWLKRKYPREYLELLAESAPDRLPAALELLDREEAERRRVMMEAKRREEEAYRDWLAAGGRG